METSIKDLTKLIKSGSTPGRLEPLNNTTSGRPSDSNKKATKNEKKGKSSKPKGPKYDDPNTHTNSFLEGMDSVQYQLKEVVKVDSDIYQMFKVLRPVLGTPIGKLMSFVLESWVRDNITFIKKAIEQNDRKNKYL